MTVILITMAYSTIRTNKNGNNKNNIRILNTVLNIVPDKQN